MENDEEIDLDKLSILDKLKKIAEKVKESWMKDVDRTKYMIELTKIIKEMITKDSIEEYFSNNEEITNYFMDDFMKEVLQYMLIQPIIIGENGDNIGIDLLFHIYKLFLKFHKNTKYAPLFEKIRCIFLDSSMHKTFFECSDHRNNNPMKQYDFSKFNSIYNSEFEIKRESVNFKVGDEVDIPIELEAAKNPLEKNVWVRGRIREIEDEEYLVEYPGEYRNEKKLPVNDYSIFPAGTKTPDWEWRQNLKKYDVIDCFDRSKWYPATILRVIEDEVNGLKRVRYKIGFRLYPQYFKNPEDENDTYDKHLDIWKQGIFSESPDSDSESEKFFGDKENCDETIICYSKRIQKFNTYSKCQQKNINYSYSSHFYYSSANETNNEMKIMNEKLENITYISVDQFYNYELNGKKNCIIGKNKDFLIYFAIFLKKVDNEGSYTKFIEILKDKPNTEEIYNIFYILLQSFPYLHIDYFKENSSIMKDALVNYINNLDNKEMRNLPKNLIEIVSDLFKKIQTFSADKDFSDIYDEMTLALSIKTIKTSIFDRRLQGIKALNEYIEKNKDNEQACEKIIKLLKKNEIIQEIFGANYHSQIINKSTDIVKLLLLKNELSEDDIKLIWSCTKRGDLEAKVTILKLLSELADNLKEDYIEILLNSIKSNISQKIDEKEVQLVYRLSIQGNNNEKNILICCDYLCQCLLSLNNTNIKNNSILDTLIQIVNRDDKYLIKVLKICEDCLKKNENSILSYVILCEIIQRITIETSEPIQNLIKDRYLLKLFEDNFYLYIKQVKELLEKNNISSTDGEIIDKYIFNGFTHLDNIKKRMEIYYELIDGLYKDYDFLPFLKEVLITKAVSPNDQLIFFNFVKKYLSSDDNESYSINDNECSTKNQKEKIKKELFDLLSDNNQKDIRVEQIQLFISLFFDMNRHKMEFRGKDDDSDIEYEIVDVEDIDQLEGLDKLWNIILKIKDEKVLSVAINIIFQIYRNKYVEKLLDKCSNLMNEENSTPEVINKCIILLKLIIIESEKNTFFQPKSHLSLLKNCLVQIPLNLTNKSSAANKEGHKNLLLGNTNYNDLKVMLSKMYDIPPKSIVFSFSDDFKNKIKEIKNLEEEDKKIFDKNHLDESNNNNTLFELLLLKNNLISEIKPNNKISFSYKKLDREPLIINGELNPKLKSIFEDWFNEFTDGSGKMDIKAAAKFISLVTNHKDTDEDDDKLKEFMEENDREHKGFLTEEEFINFYYTAAVGGKINIVWKNLDKRGIREDLNKKGTPYEINLTDNEKLPRYKLGNDLSLIQNLIRKYYKNPNENSLLFEFLLYLTTNEYIYNEVLNMYKEENKDSLVNKALIDGNKYIEQNYIFIIIESIFQDLELYLYNKSVDSNDSIILGGNQYILLANKYEPFDNEEKYLLKINFLKNLVKSENFKKIIKYFNNLIQKIIDINNDANENQNNKSILNILYTCGLRGIKIINIINNLASNNDKENSKCTEELKEKNIYDLGYCNLSSLLDEIDFKLELNNISYADLVNNLLNYLNNYNNKANETKKEEKEVEKIFNQKCLELLIDLLSSKRKLLTEFTSKDENKKTLINDLFKKNLSENDSENKSYFIKYINHSIQEAILNQNNEYILFLYKIANSLLDSLLNFQTETEDDQNKNKEIFSPDSNFFDLYNHLYKLFNIIKNEDNATNENIINKGNSFLEKIYDLLMKGLLENLRNEDKKMDSKILLSLFKLFNISLKDNEKTKNELLFKEKNGTTLFDLLFEQFLSQINEGKKSDEESGSGDLIQNEEKTKESEEDKFICLETIKEEKKEDNKSLEVLNELINDFIINSLKESKNPNLISKLLEIIKYYKKSIKKKKNGINTDEESEEKNEDETTSLNYFSSYSKRQYGHVGLKNLGCICYMNSIMQQVYMVPTFRYAIMHADDGETPKPASNFRYTIDDDNLLHQLQEMYTYLTFSEKMDYNPRSFCYSFKDFDGNPINVGAQQDSQEFYNNLCDKIENSLKKTKFKYIVNDVFTGRTCSSVLCQNCKNISNRFEDFYNLTLEVKNINNLNDSLQKLIVPEIIDEFNCSNCNQKVRISKITSLNKLPNVLVVHLKRFYLDYETCHTRKINSKFEFPKKLNLKLFCVEEITKNFGSSQNETAEIYSREDEYYQYELKGINVHTGSADGGHYFSFINVERDGKDNIMNENPENKNNWLTFNDSHVSEFDTDKIPSECFGGSSEGYSYENCQNAYLLIYERKKKSPIKIIIDESEAKKAKEENIVKFDKEKRNEINKKYDLSRIGNDITEEVLYSKIFFDTEKEEYYKYIPYYNIPKYAPRKVYNEVMKDNNKTPSTKSSNKKNNDRLKKCKEILIEKLKNSNFDIKSEKYDDTAKENILSIVLTDFMKQLNKKQSWKKEEKEEINKELSYIIKKLIKPLIDEKTDISILKVINRALAKDENSSKIFSVSSNSLFESKNIINIENAKIISEILHDLTLIFIEKRQETKYYNEAKFILSALFDLISSSKTKKSNFMQSRDEDEPSPVIYIYELFNKFLRTSEIILSNLIDNKLITTLLGKLDEEKREIREVIYDMVIYTLKRTDDYNKNIFDLKENEKKGDYTFKDKAYVRNSMEKDLVNILFEEKKEILFMLLKILENDDESFTKHFNSQIHRLFKEYNNKNKDDDLLELLLTLIKINDELTFERLITFLGYPRLAFVPIPKEKNKKPKKIQNSYHNNSEEDSDKERKDSDNEDEKEKEKVPTEIQKWPLFGEKLINGDINKHIYEYVVPNHRKNAICLLSMLFPSEYQKKENEKVEKKKEKEDNEYNFYINRNESDEDEKKIKIIISEEKKKKILFDIITNCLGSRNNYALFKYIYLMPARSLLYKNLYEEIVACFKDDKSYNLEEFKEKEDKYIKNIEREINYNIEKVRKKGNTPSNYYMNDDDDDDEYENGAIPAGVEIFKCKDKTLKKFIGFISDIIPGEIVREEIVEIATSSSMAMYRLEYFTKYYKVDELRDILLNHKDKVKDENKEKENKKEASLENNEKKLDEKNKEKGEEEQKKEEEKLDEEKKEEEKKEEETKEEEKLDDEKKEEDKKEEDKKEEEKKDNVDNQAIEKEAKKEEQKEKQKEEQQITPDKEEEKQNQEDVAKEIKDEPKDIQNEEKENKEEEHKSEEKDDKDDKIPSKEESKEEIETEITNKLDEKDTTIKCDVSQKNENSFIYDLFGRRVSAYILEDKSLKNKNKVKSTFVRFIFLKTDSHSKNFKATIKRQNSMSKLIKLNFFSPNLIADRVEGNDNINFHSIYRIKGDLPFIKNESISITIDFN